MVLALSLTVCSFAATVAEAAFVAPAAVFCKKLRQVVVKPKRVQSNRVRATAARGQGLQARAVTKRSLHSGRREKRLKKVNLPTTREYCSAPRPVYQPIISRKRLNGR